MLTIFTPTYNRGHLLPRLFNSLLQQEKYDFEWLIVDDGSIDDTKDLIKDFKNSSKFKITYIYQDNQGKHVAINTAIDNCTTPYLMTIDSDDILIPNILPLIYKKIYQINNNHNLVAIVSPIKVMNTIDFQITGRLENDVISNSFLVNKEYSIVGEFTFIFKTSILKKFKYPVFKNEKFIKESLVYKRISSSYNFLYIKDYLVEAEYQTDGLSSNFKRLLENNPKGAALVYKELMNYPQLDLKNRLDAAVLFWKFENIIGNKSFLNKIKMIKGIRLKYYFLQLKFKKYVR